MVMIRDRMKILLAAGSNSQRLKFKPNLNILEASREALKI